MLGRGEVFHNEASRGRLFRASSPISLHIIEERHKAEVHVQLLVAVEEREAGVIRNKIYFGFLVASEHHDIFQYSRRWLSCQAGQLETMAVEVDGMNIVTRVAHPEAI